MLQLFCCEESLQYMIRNGLHPLFCDLTACKSCYASKTHLQDQFEGNLQLIADVLSQNMSEVYISRNKLQVNKTYTKLFYQNYKKIPNNNLIIKNPLNNVKLNKYVPYYSSVEHIWSPGPVSTMLCNGTIHHCYFYNWPYAPLMTQKRRGHRSNLYSTPFYTQSRSHL